MQNFLLFFFLLLIMSTHTFTQRESVTIFLKNISYNQNPNKKLQVKKKGN